MRFRAPIASGTVTLTFRRWKRCQAIAGHQYRTAAGRLEVEDVRIVEPEQITDADARRAGSPSADALRADLRGPDDVPLYRVAFHPVTDPDPREELANTSTLTADDITEIDRRLARLDHASSYGPWTAETLAAIAARPGVRAPDLAASFGRETAPFKLDVRKLKNLGLTLSLRIGYRLSPRGEAYVNRKAP